MNPLDFVRGNPQTIENLHTIYDAALEFSDPVKFGMQALMLQNVPAWKMKVFSENQNSVAFAQDNLFNANQAALAELRADRPLHLLERGPQHAHAHKDANGLYQQMAQLWRQLREAAVIGAEPAILAKVSIFDDQDKSTSDWAKQKVAVKYLRKAFKRDPAALTESIADMMLDIDKEMTVCALLSTVEIVDTCLVNTPLADKYDVAGLRKAWVGSILALTDDSRKTSTKPIELLVASKVLHKSIIGTLDTLLDVPELRLGKTKKMRHTAAAIRAHRKLQTTMLTESTGQQAESYAHHLQGKTIDEAMETAEAAIQPILRIRSVKQQALSEVKVDSELTEPEVDIWYTDPLVEAAGLTALADTVRGEHQDLRQAWDMSRNQLKKLGLLGLIREMQSDHVDWSGKIDIESYSIARTLIRLQEYAAEGGMPALASLFEHEDFLRRQYAVAQNGLRDIGRESSILKTPLPADLERIYADFEAVRGNWDSLWPLILEFWPDEQGADVVERLECLFGLMPPEAPQIEVPEQPTAEDIAEPEPVPVDQAEVEHDSFIDPELIGIADEQLNMLVFPNTKEGLRGLMQDVRDHIPVERHDDIEWWRIKLLHRIKGETGGTLYRTEPGNFGHKLPWYVLHFEQSNVSLALVEHPVEGNATYLVRDEYDGFWQELVGGHNRNTAREFGQKQIFHPDRDLAAQADLHYAALRNHIIDSLTVKA